MDLIKFILLKIVKSWLTVLLKMTLFKIVKSWATVLLKMACQPVLVGR